jgi:hypothetical protein
MCKHFEMQFGAIRVGRARPNPEVILDLKPVSISSVCKYVLPFNNPLPEDVFQKLFCELLIEYVVPKGELDTDPTYGTAAHCFLKLIEHHKRDHHGREE